jgi:hypothetical protein
MSNFLDGVCNLSQSFMVLSSRGKSLLINKIAINICRQISRTTTAQTIKYEILPTKIAATNLIDKSGLQESNPRS